MKTILGAILLFFVFGIAHSLQADNVIIYQSIPNPSLHFKLNETVYFVVYNNGTSPVYISNLTHEWEFRNGGYKRYIDYVVSSFIGNDVGDYPPNVYVVDGKYVKTNLNAPIRVEPGSYVEWYYTFVPKNFKKTIYSTMTVEFNDSSTKSRVETIYSQPSPVIQTDFKIDNSDFSTAEGADGNITANNEYNVTFRVSNFANLVSGHYGGFHGVTVYNGTIFIQFPQGVSVSPVSGNVTCGGNLCNCSVAFDLYTPPQICVVNVIFPSEGEYVIYANASDNSALLPLIFPMNSKSELLVKVSAAHCPPPTIVNAYFSPSEIHFGEYINVNAHVIGPPPIESVIVQVGSKNMSLHLVNGTHLDGYYFVRVYPNREGYLPVKVYAKNKCGAISEVDLGTIHVSPPIAPPSPEACNNVTTIGLARLPGIIDADKLAALLNTDYYCVKNVLGLWDYDFYLEVKYLDGTPVKVDNKNVFYGIAPGRSSSDVIYGIVGTGVSARDKGGLATPTISTSPGVFPQTVPNEGGYSKAIFFDRIAVLKTNSSYEVIRISLGVWK